MCTIDNIVTLLFVIVSFLFFLLHSYWTRESMNIDKESWTWLWPMYFYLLLLSVYIFIIFALFLKLYKPDANIFLSNLLVKCTHTVIIYTKRVLRNLINSKYDWISKLTLVANDPLTAFTLLFTSILKWCLTYVNIEWSSDYPISSPIRHTFSVLILSRNPDKNILLMTFYFGALHWFWTED